MSEQKVMNRWMVVVGAILVQLALGAIYAWSVFTPQLTDAGWTKADTQWVFAIGLAFFAIVMVLAGKLMPKVGPRKLTVAGGIVLGAGYALAGLMNTTDFWPIFLLIGVVGGSGIGLAYVVPIAVGMRWFPDKKGLITGLAVAGFGFGAMGWVKMAGTWGHLIENMGLSTTFLIYGVAFLVMVVLGGIFMVFPPEGWLPEGYTPPATTGAGGPAKGTVDFTSAEMLSKPQFFMIFFGFVAGGGAGLMSIGLMKLFPMEALMANGMTEIEASAIAGTAMAIWFSLGNGFGRILWGAMSDKLGRKLSVVLMLASQGVLVLTFPYMAGSQWPLWIFAGLIGFNFGGNFSLFPTITADTFGAKNVGQNYPFIFLAYGVGGIAGPMMGGILGDMGNFPLAFTICGVAVLVAAGVVAMVRPPQKATHPANNQTAAASA